MDSKRNQDLIEQFARKHSIPPKKTDNIRSGFDLTKYVEVRTYEPGERLFQFVRRPYADIGRPFDQTINPPLGNWFALKGATMAGLAVFGGLSGRRLLELEVKREIEGLEGTATPMSENWGWAGGGPGGGTQIFIPDRWLLSLQGLGAAAF